MFLVTQLLHCSTATLILVTPACRETQRCVLQSKWASACVCVSYWSCIRATQRNAGAVTSCGGGDGGHEVTLLWRSYSPDHTLSPSPGRPGSPLRPCAVIGHTAQPGSLCFALQRLCGRRAQAVGLINLRDSSVRPRIAAPLLHNDFTPTRIPSVPHSGRAPRKFIPWLLCDVCIAHCVTESFCFLTHPNLARFRYCSEAVIIDLSALFASFRLHRERCLAWTHFTGFLNYSCGFQTGSNMVQ